MTHQKTHRRETSQIGLQIKSLQALFDPRTLHEKCCSDKSTKSGPSSTKPPLRKRNLPPSFFKEPSHDIQDGFGATLTPNEYPFNFNEISTENCHSLPSDTIESILGEADFHDLLIGSWNDGNCARDSSAMSAYGGPSGNTSPGSYTDSSDGNCSVSSISYEPMTSCNVNICQTSHTSAPTCDLDSLHSDAMMTSLSMHSQTPFYQNSFEQTNCMTDTGNNVTVSKADGFLPMLNEPYEKHMLYNDVISENHETELPNGILPGFPQTFCGQSNRLDSSETPNICNWNENSHFKPCYTYL